MGLPLVAFFAVLMAMGWALGLAICGGILRHGMGAESLAWTVIFALAPLSCVYYPVIDIAGMAAAGRLGAALDLCLRGDAGGAVRAASSAPIISCTAIALDLVYLAIGAAIFFIAFRNARRRGALLQMGE